ncbi:BRO-N domain-containing protein [Schaalia sp. ZJ405]|uniref:BRO-N domain-containing protein n=1 Tax=Schaalia sp. ZJ405 TaxID=2709403 RepID=UPI003FA7AF2F
MYAKDAATALGYTNTNKAIKDHCDRNHHTLCTYKQVKAPFSTESFPITPEPRPRLLHRPHHATSVRVIWSPACHRGNRPWGRGTETRDLVARGSQCRCSGEYTHRKIRLHPRSSSRQLPGTPVRWKETRRLGE